jgi:hypothetical protein
MQDEKRSGPYPNTFWRVIRLRSGDQNLSAVQPILVQTEPFEEQHEALAAVFLGTLAGTAATNRYILQTNTSQRL